MNIQAFAMNVREDVRNTALTPPIKIDIARCAPCDIVLRFRSMPRC